jgi:hypothetical protein
MARPKARTALAFVISFAITCLLTALYGGKGGLPAAAAGGPPQARAFALRAPAPLPRCIASLLRDVRAEGFGCTAIDWREWNAKPATQALIARSGGLTPTMRAFMEVYEAQAWDSASTPLLPRRCGSGAGSHPAFAARTACLLATLLPALGVTLLVDFPSGDQQWAPLLRAQLPELKYLGVDAMPGVVQRSLELFGAPGRTEFQLAELGVPDVFATLRARSGVWGGGDTVAVLSRHVLEHNAAEVGVAFLRAVNSSGAVYFITTSFSQVANAPEAMILGGYTAVDIHRHPFSLRRGLLEWLETPEGVGNDAHSSGPFMELFEVAHMFPEAP